MLWPGLSPNLDVACTCEHRTSEMRYFNAGTHEITLGLRFNNRFSIVCPEFLWQVARREFACKKVVRVWL